MKKGTFYQLPPCDPTTPPESLTTKQGSTPSCCSTNDVLQKNDVARRLRQLQTHEDGKR